MSDDFFENPFTEDTNVKLDLYREYLRNWLPVFIAAKIPFKQRVNLFDLFSGPGTDSEGTHGSPLIALDVLNEFCESVNDTDIEIHLYFNDYVKKYIDTLRENVNQFNFNREKITIHFSTLDFHVFFPKLIEYTNDSANLIFLDQFGLKYVNRDKFLKLIQLPVTDVLFFISSSTFNRFPDDPNITKVIGLTSIQIKQQPFYEIHKLVHQRYSEMIPSDHQYWLAPFSIRKGSNIYGLIFGSGHLLGIEKFITICWNMDKLTGEANFDIRGDAQRQYTLSLFESEDDKLKVEVFQDVLKQKILDGRLKTDLDIYLFAIKEGFLARHIQPVIKELKKQKKISVKYPGFTYKTLFSAGRELKIIKVIG